MSATQQTPALFKPIKVGRLTLRHRVVHAPLTRFRAHASHVPGPQHAIYYAQRASEPGTLLITEGTLISHDAGGYSHVPGTFTEEQIRGWKKVTDAVHAKGSHIFLQLCAVGRAADIDILENQDPPSPYIGPSAIPLTGRTGIDQFIQTTSNQRTDRWGGDEEGRTRFARGVVDAVVDAIGADQIGFRISPWSTFQDMRMPDPRPTFAYLATALREKHPNLAYLHVVKPRIAGIVDSDGAEGEDNDFLRKIWNGGQGTESSVFISAGGYTRETALRTAEDKGGLVAFGRFYIPNPDLPARLQKNLPLTRGDRSTYYLPGNLTPFGYSDWPFVDGTVRGIDGRLE